MPPALHTSKGMDRPPRWFFGLTPEHTPTLAPYEEPIRPHLSERMREPVTCFHSSFCSRNCNKSLPEFLTDFSCFRRTRTMVGSILSGIVMDSCPLPRRGSGHVQDHGMKPPCDPRAPESRFSVTAGGKSAFLAPGGLRILIWAMLSSPLCPLLVLSFRESGHQAATTSLLPACETCPLWPRAHLTGDKQKCRGSPDGRFIS